MSETRNKGILALRPNIPAAVVHDNMSDEEQFQNATLRPVIKFLHPIFIEVCKSYISRKKNVFYELSKEKRIVYIENTLFKDTQFRIELRGMVIGQFTVEEFKAYSKYAGNLNKRMLSMIKERILTNLPELEKTQP